VEEYESDLKSVAKQLTLTLQDKRDKEAQVQQKMTLFGGAENPPDTARNPRAAILENPGELITKIVVLLALLSRLHNIYYSMGAIIVF
jgi:hypothetical protein